VTVCRGRITAHCAHTPEQLDAAGLLVAPGLVDLHLHGALGHDLTDPGPQIWQKILDTHLRTGTTTALATLASTGPAATITALTTAADLMNSGSTPTLAGVHLEGPCLDPGQRGAHDPARLRPPADLLRELTPLPTALRMVTLAPELPGADALISYLVAHRVTVSVGHSAATPAQLEHAQGLGLRHVAHLWSGQSALTRPGVHRVPGLLEASLASDGLTAEIIADGHHLPAELLTIALRCLGPGRLCLVSDATAGLGLDQGELFHTGDTVGVVDHGFATTTDRTSLCGSTVPLAVTAARMRELTGARVDDVLTMATATPATVAGLYPSKGSLRHGADGDLVLLTPDLTVRTVVLAGAEVRTETGGRR
jgi:N-acetylglucosamine-6-phosphate deacetylase